MDSRPLHARGFRNCGLTVSCRTIVRSSCFTPFVTEHLMSFQSRRSFLRNSSLLAGMAACGTLPGTAFAAQADSAKLGIQLYSLRGFNREQALEHA
ncbi:MAG: twin-arginine translocation signal domain-containing protein, partial [Planctomycetaceae bacterium]